jgi:hypothetical protein
MSKLIKNTAIFVVTLICFLPTAQSLAQKMYRCGNVYQDHPCEGGKQGKEITAGASNRRVANTAPTASSTSASRPQCVERGEASLKIVWSREAGIMQERMLSTETSPDRRKLIADVYRVRGTAPQVRARIEAECEAEMDEKAKLLALHQAMVRAGATSAAEPAPAGPTAAEKSAAAEQQARDNKQREASAKKARCDELTADADSLLSQQRSGGSASYMDSLRQHRDRVNDEIRKLHC